MSTTIRKSLPSTMQQAGDARTFNVTISTGSLDRDNDTLDPRGWQLDAFKANPIVLFNHDRGKPPIARATDVRVVGNQLRAVMQFPPSGISPLADEIHGLMAEGFLHSTSVGFLPIEWTSNGYGGKQYTKQELTEFSVVNIPSQVEARVLRCASQPCDAAAIKAWLGRVREQAPAIGRQVSEAVAASLRYRLQDEAIPPPDPSIARNEDKAVLMLQDEPVSPAAQRIGREAGRLAREALRKSWDQPVLEITEVYDVDEHVLKAGVEAAVVTLLKHEAEVAVTKAIRYAQGKVS